MQYIEKSVESSNGAIATIWVINSMNVTVDLSSQTPITKWQFNLAGYLNKEKYLAGKTPLLSKSVTIDSDDDSSRAIMSLIALDDKFVNGIVKDF